MFFVLDQSWLRRHELRTELEGSKGQTQVLLTDTALVEMIKCENWQLICRSNLAIIKDFPDSVWVGHGHPTLVNYEIETLVPISNYISVEMTAEVRTMLQEFRDTGSLTKFNTCMAARKAEAWPEIERFQLNFVSNAKLLRRTVADHDENVPKSLLRDIRKAGDQLPLEAKEWAIIRALQYCKDAFEIRFGDPLIGLRLVERDCFMFRLMLGHVLMGLHWLEKAGLQTMQDETVNNQILDLDYVIAASYGRGVLTREKYLRDLAQDLRDCLSIAFRPTTNNTT